MSELAVGQLKGLLVNSNKITIPSGHVLYSPGHIIQVVSTDFTGQYSSSSGTVQDVAGFSATIQPKSATSKILVTVSVAFGFANDAYPYVLLKRNGTSIGTGTSATGSQINTFLSGTAAAIGDANNYRYHQVSKTYMDSPSTTSPLTYQIAFASPYAGYAGHINRQNASNTINNVYMQYPTSSIVLMEVAQ